MKRKKKLGPKPLRVYRLEDRAPKWATRATLRLIESMNPTLADFWVWNMTPMPMGRPSWRQLFHGLRAVSLIRNPKKRLV